MRKKMEKVIYGMLWALAALGTAAYFSLKNIKALSYMPCLFYRVTGFTVRAAEGHEPSGNCVTGIC